MAAIVMSQEEANSLVCAAIQLLVQRDEELLLLGASERSLSHKLAHYMELSDAIQAPLTVDCEYNRHFGDPKILDLPQRRALDREIRATTVFPDIVVHLRNSDEANLIVLEVKKPTQSIEYDRKKLLAFKSQLNYVHAGHVILGRDARGCLVRDVRWI